MHPFCCAPPVPVSPAAAAADTTSPLCPSMTPPPPLSIRSNSASAAASRSHDASPHHHRNGFRWVAAGLQRSKSLREGLLLHCRDHREVKINDIVGNGIAGILFKWVNYGKGWRPRWFVLQDGVLSYYKIHGPDRIELNCETEKGTKVIGEESVRRLSRRKNGQSHHPRKPFGEVHLKASKKPIPSLPTHPSSDRIPFDSFLVLLVDFFLNLYWIFIGLGFVD